MSRFEPYAIDSGKDAGGNDKGWTGARYAIRVGGTGGRIIGRDLGLNHAGAETVCGLLRNAYEMGVESMVSA